MHIFILQCEMYNDKVPVLMYGFTAIIFRVALEYLHEIPLAYSKWKKNSIALIDTAD